jgi:hypothetical protein
VPDLIKAMFGEQDRVLKEMPNRPNTFPSVREWGIDLLKRLLETEPYSNENADG